MTATLQQIKLRQFESKLVVPSNKSLVISAYERRLYQNQLYLACTRMLDKNVDQTGKHKLHVLVNTIESSVYKTASTKEQYCKDLSAKLNFIKQKLENSISNSENSAQLEASTNSVVALDLQPTLELSGNLHHITCLLLPAIKHSSGSSFSASEQSQEKQVSKKLEEMQKYLMPLVGLISICKQQLLNQNLSEAKRDYLTSSIEKLELMKSVLEGSPFNVPENVEKIEVLHKIEKQLLTIVQQLKKQTESKLVEPISLTEPLADLSSSDSQLLSLKILLDRLKLEQFLDVFLSNHILSIKDLELLSDSDLISLSIPLGARNRIREHFTHLHNPIKVVVPPQVQSQVSAQQQLEELRAQYSAQMFEHFKCPITHELMADPVIAADGHTYERDAICKWFQQSKSSPLTGMKIPDTLISNHNLRSQIKQFCSVIINDVSCDNS